MEQIKNKMDPKYIGPGIWYALHLTAKNAINTEGKKVCVKFLEYLRLEFPCEKCREHINIFLKTHPYDPFVASKDEQSMFRYTWIFHNIVNSRLNKPIMSWEQALSIYYGNPINKVCMGDCNGKEESEPTFLFTYPKTHK